MTAIATSGLTRQFGDVTAVDGLDLSVGEGEVYGFLGPNGAGKSTTINLLLDFVTPTSGSATVLGMDSQTESLAIRRRTGILPEGFAAYERLTGREHVEYAIETKDADDDPDELLDRVGLDREATRRPAGDYSTGMGQRLALATALVGDPDLLVLDEPSSGLDPTGMQEMRDLIREEAAGGTTVFFSSHILPEVEAVCDRVGIMNQGTLVAEDTIEGLRDLSGSRSRLELSVESIPADLGVADLDGVAEVRSRDSTIEVDCVDPRAKVEVVKRVDRATTVEDILSEDASLEELFNSYTNGEEGSQ